jgi:hypothetical protein
MTAWVRSENIVNWAGMWMRVDGGNTRDTHKTLSFDNMQSRPIKDTGDWRECEIVLDVPMESTSLNFGVLLVGTGKVWFDDVSFEVVDDSIASTSMVAVGGNPRRQPTNLNFD